MKMLNTVLALVPMKLDLWANIITAIETFYNSIKPIVTPLAIAVIILCAILYMTSKKKSEEAKEWLVRAILGAAIAGLANSIVSWIVSIVGF